MKIKLKNKKKVGLVFSGGGIKAAAFHIGVCLALKEKGFQFAGGSKEDVRRAFDLDDPKVIRLYVGSSAGAFVSAILAGGYSVEALINAFNVGAGSKPRFNDKHSRHSLKPIGYRDIFSINGREILKSVPLSLLRRSLLSGGLETLLKERFKLNGFFTTKALEKYLREYALAHNHFEDLGAELVIVSTQLNHTRKVLFGQFPETTKTSNLYRINYATISEAVAASTSLPPVFAPFKIRSPQGKDMYFFDGEIRDTLSTHVAQDHGADLVIASYSVQPYHYTEEIGSLHNFGIPVILNQALYQVIQQKIDRHIRHQQDLKAIYNSVDGFCKQNNIPDESREKLLEIIRVRSNFSPKTDSIYIHPRPQDYEMFFADHFSLSPSMLERIVRIGFRSAIHTLRQYDL